MLKTDVCRKHTHRMDLVRKRDLVLLTGISSVLRIVLGGWWALRRF